MNKRQLKKRFKKEYGENPDKLINSFCIACKTLIENLKEWCNQIPIVMIDLKERIQTMPDEEFNERIEQLTDEQKELVMKVRTMRN